MVNEHHTEQKLIRANPVPQPEHLHGDPSEAQALLALIMERRDAMTMTKQPAGIRAPRGPRWQSARIAAAAAVLVVLVIGAAALIGFAGDGSDTADQATSVPAVESTIPESEATVPPVTDTPAATPQTTTLPAEAPATLFDGSWQHQTSEQPFPRFEVVETSLGFFSRGDNIAGREGGPGVWFSPDGADWQQVLTMPVGEVIEDADTAPGRAADLHDRGERALLHRIRRGRVRIRIDPRPGPGPDSATPGRLSHDGRSRVRGDHLQHRIVQPVGHRRRERDARDSR